MIRRLRRAFALAIALAISLLRYGAERLNGSMTMEKRALWLQEASKRVLASLNLSYVAHGEPPVRGLVVSNHLSYLDIAILSAVMPCFFIAKLEVGRWPVFGTAARAGGTIFLNRKSMASANEAARMIAARLALTIPVVLFPEATSSDGTQVQRFHSRLIHPATAAGSPVTSVALRYFAGRGVQSAMAERDLCWYGDATFLRHLWNVLGTDRLSATLQFGESRIYPDGRTAAQQTHDEISAMRNSKQPTAIDAVR